jgi:hypothetical protein
MLPSASKSPREQSLGATFVRVNIRAEKRARQNSGRRKFACRRALARRGMTPVVARDSISNIGASQIRERAAGRPNRRNSSGFLANAPRNSRWPMSTCQAAGRWAREGCGRGGRYLRGPDNSSKTEDKAGAHYLHALRKKTRSSRKIH